MQLGLCDRLQEHSFQDSKKSGWRKEKDSRKRDKHGDEEEEEH